MGRQKLLKTKGYLLLKFPMIPPQVNGATAILSHGGDDRDVDKFPMIPPQVNGATNGFRLGTNARTVKVSNDSAPS